MAATITMNCVRVFQRINCNKHFQSCHPGVFKAQNFDVLKDIHRSSWYSFFFRSDQSMSKKDEEKKNEEEFVAKEKVKTFSSKPKPPPNVFLAFVKSVEEEILNKNPGMHRKQIMVEASKIWRQMDPEEKSRLSILRKELYEKYQQELSEYIDNMTPQQMQEDMEEKERIAKMKQKKEKKQLQVPKKTRAAYSWFIKEKLSQMDKSQPIVEKFQETKNMWHKLTEKEKQVYHEKYLEDRDRYIEEMAKWEEGMIEIGRFDLIRKSTLSSIRRIKKKKIKSIIESQKKNRIID